MLYDDALCRGMELEAFLGTRVHFLLFFQVKIEFDLGDDNHTVVFFVEKRNKS